MNTIKDSCYLYYMQNDFISTKTFFVKYLKLKMRLEKNAPGNPESLWNYFFLPISDIFSINYSIEF